MQGRRMHVRGSGSASPRQRSRIAAAVVIAPIALSLAAGCSNKSESSDSKETTTTAKGATTTEPTTTIANDATMGDPPTGDTANYNIAQLAAGTPDLQTLTRLVVTNGLLPTVATGGPFTVFAPTNDAFGKLDPATLQKVLDDGDLASSILLLHVVPGTLTKADLEKAVGTSLETAGGGKLLVEKDGDDIVVGGAKIVAPDVKASNGVVHVVDTPIAAPNG